MLSQQVKALAPPLPVALPGHLFASQQLVAGDQISSQTAAAHPAIPYEPLTGRNVCFQLLAAGAKMSSWQLVLRPATPHEDSMGRPVHSQLLAAVEEMPCAEAAQGVQRRKLLIQAGAGQAGLAHPGQGWSAFPLSNLQTLKLLIIPQSKDLVRGLGQNLIELLGLGGTA